MNTRCATAISLVVCSVIGCGDDGTTPRDAECQNRDPVCDAPDAPLTSTLSRGVSGVAVYETDVLRNDCPADCGAITSATLLVATDELVATEAAAAAEVAAASADAWIEHDGYFDLDADEGPHLFCIRAPSRDAEPTRCAGIEFGTDTVYTAVLMTIYGPSTLYVTRNSDASAVETFEVAAE